MRKFILGLDEGTTSARSVLYDVNSHEIVDSEGKPFKQFYPHSGWVEQDPEEIYKVIMSTSRSIFRRQEISKSELVGIGITNQRETVVAWNRLTGEPIYNAIVWMDRRTSENIDKLSSKTKVLIQKKTGLIPNAYFSASKMQWIMENVKQAKELAREYNLCFGTIDCYLAYKLTGNFVTDTTNASRTMLMNIHTLEWDDELLKIFNIPKHCLPEIKACDAHFGDVPKMMGAPLCSMIGDQMSSLVGQGGVEMGNTKVTYGTGGFILSNIGTTSNKSVPSMLTTVASTLNGKTQYAIEGSIYSACSAINWLKNNLEFFRSPSETEAMAKTLKDNEGVYVVPAFTGLGAPYWNDNARAMIYGMTFNTNKNHIVRATLESMAYNTKAIFDEMKTYGQEFKVISVDGGGSNNKFLLQFLADMLNHNIMKSKYSESTVLGCIFVAMLSQKIIKLNDIKLLTKSSETYKPKMKAQERDKLYEGWTKAVDSCMEE